MPLLRHCSARTRVYAASHSLLTPYMLPGQPCSPKAPDLTPHSRTPARGLPPRPRYWRPQSALLRASLLMMRSFPARLWFRNMEKSVNPARNAPSSALSASHQCCSYSSAQVLPMHARCLCTPSNASASPLLVRAAFLDCTREPIFVTACCHSPHYCS